MFFVDRALVECSKVLVRFGIVVEDCGFTFIAMESKFNLAQAPVNVWDHYHRKEFTFSCFDDSTDAYNFYNYLVREEGWKNV